MKIRFFICLSVALFITNGIVAQIVKDSTNFSDDSTSSSIEPLSVQVIKSEDKINWHTMITNVPHDISEFSTAAFNTNKIPTYALLAAGTGALILIDEQGWQTNRRLFNESKTFHNLSDLGVSFGEEKYHLIVAGLFGAYGLIDSDSRSLKTGSNIIEAIIASGLSVQILKRIFGRESPAAATESAGDWNLFPNLKEYQNHQPKYYAYPSGHITTLTATITVLANNYPEAKWIKPVGYSAIALCGIGLVSRGMHWYSDLPLGFFIGYTFGNLISPVQDEVNSPETNANKIHLSPYVGFDNLGVQFSLVF